MKFLEDRVGENLDDLGYGYAFLDTISKAWSMREISDKLDFIKFKNFCSGKDNVERIRRQATDREKIFAKDTSDQGLLSKTKNSWNSTIENKWQTDNRKKRAKDVNRHLSKEDIQMASKHMKRCSRDFPGGPGVKNPPSSAGNVGLIPGRGTKIPHATTTELLVHINKRARVPQTTEPMCSGARVPQLEREKPARHN